MGDAGIRLPVSAVIVCCMLAAAADGLSETVDYLGPTALVASRDGAVLFVANTDARQIAVVDIARAVVGRRITVPGRPTGLE